MSEDDYLDNLLMEEAVEGGDGLNKADLAEEDTPFGEPHADSIEKGRRYISDPSEAPEGVEIHEGEQGGIWYDTAEAGEDMGTGDDPDSVGVEGGDGGGDAGGGASEITGDDLDRMTIDALAENAAYEAQEWGHDPDQTAERFYQRVEQGEDIAEAYASVTEGTSPESVREMLTEEESFDDINYDLGGGDEGGGAVDQIDEPYRDNLGDLGEDAVNQMAEVNEDAAVEYAEEALHQNGAYFDEFDSVEDVMDDFEIFLEHHPDYEG